MLGRVASKFFNLRWVGLGWVTQLMDRVGPRRGKWTDGRLLAVQLALDSGQEDPEKNH